MYKVFSEFVEVNPRTDLPSGASASMKVSFIPMSDVTEFGDWIGNRERALGTVRNGFTAFSDGDVLVAKITPCFENGKGAHVIGLTNGIGFGSTEFHVLRARDGASQRFIHHVAQSPNLRRTAEAFMSGSAGQRRVPSDFFKRYLVPDISFKEQVTLGEILDALDTTIRQTEVIIEKLRQVKQGLLHDLLTRGIDADGKLRPPQSQAPHLYKNSPLGWIPNDWNALQFSELAEYANGNTFDADCWSSQGLPIIRIQNLNGSTSFNYFEGPVNSRWHVLPGDLLFAWSGQRGVSFGPRIWPGPEGVLNQHIFKVIAKSKVISKEFLFEVLRFRQSAIEDSAHGFKDSFLHVTRGELGAVFAGIPQPDEQSAINIRIAAFESKLMAERANLSKNMALKVALMDDLLTGRVRVTSLLGKINE